MRIAHIQMKSTFICLDDFHISESKLCRPNLLLVTERNHFDFSHFLTFMAASKVENVVITTICSSIHEKPMKNEVTITNKQKRKKNFNGQVECK